MKIAMPRKRERGSTTLDLLFASALIAQSFGVFTQLSYANSTDLQTLAASQYMTQFSGAVQQYVADNASSILSSSLPKQISASTLTPAYLPAGTSSTNPLGQTVCAKVVSPAANQLSALVMTDGATLPGAQQQKLALNLGAKAGVVATAGGPLTGVGGSWSMSNATLQSYGTCSAGAGTAMGKGQVAVNIFFSSLSLTSDYLHRTAIPGNGSATTMNSPLGLATVTDGATCTQTGQIAATSMGVIESCQGSVWTAAGGGSWKAPAASYATLPTSGNASGDARVTTDTQRMYLWNGAAWSATGVDQNGNLTVPGDVTAKTLTLTGTATEGGSCLKNGQISLDGAGASLSCQGGIWTNNGVGYNQTWSDQTNNRSLGVIYTNNRNKPISITVYTMCSGGGAAYLYVNGLNILGMNNFYTGSGYSAYVNGIIPPHQTYEVTAIRGACSSTWFELS